jgi:hypothetical protein
MQATTCKLQLSAQSIATPLFALLRRKTPIILTCDLGHLQYNSE